MPECDTNYYKTCREMAGLTQESAAERLAVSVRTLAAYETFEREIPMTMVDAMAMAYKAPGLAHYFFKSTCLGKYLPNVSLPQSAVDMGFQTVLAHGDVERAEEIIKETLSDGEIDPGKYDALRTYKNVVALATDRLLSAKVYADSVLSECSA